MVALEAFRQGDVYLDYPFENVKARYENQTQSNLGLRNIPEDSQTLTLETRPRNLRALVDPSSGTIDLLGGPGL